MQENYKAALEDSIKSVKLDESFTKVWTTDLSLSLKIRTLLALFLGSSRGAGGGVRGECTQDPGNEARTPQDINSHSAPPPPTSKGVRVKFAVIIM